MLLVIHKEKQWDGGRKVRLGLLDFDSSACTIKKSDDLTYFHATLKPLPTQPQPNCTLEFKVFNNSDPPLTNSLSLFVYNSWAALLVQYLGDLLVLINSIITYRCKVGFKGPLSHYISKNLSTALLDALRMTAMLLEDLELRWVVPVDKQYPFMYSLLGFILKLNRKLQQIYYLSHP